MTASSERPSGRETAARGARSLWLWLALACGLAVAFAVDGPVMAALRPLHESPVADFLRHRVRWLGVGYTQIAALLLMLAIGAVVSRRIASAGAWGLLAFAISGAAANILKVVVHRPRPWTTAPPPESWLGYVSLHDYQSFPSGESTTTFALAAVLSAWFPRLHFPLLLAAAVVAAARVVPGDHFPSDVWAGAVLGLAAGRLSIALAVRRRGRGPAPPSAEEAQQLR